MYRYMTLAIAWLAAVCVAAGLRAAEPTNDPPTGQGASLDPGPTSDPRATDGSPDVTRRTLALRLRERADINMVRSLTAIDADVRAALRDEAISRRRGPNVDEVMRLVELYREMAAHPRRDQSRMLVQMGLNVRGRLADVAKDIERKVAQTDRGKSRSKPPTAARVKPEERVLAQQLPPPGGGPAGQGQGGQPAGGQAGRAPAFDYGPELVEIIQTAISPSTWDIHGGPGAVVYYAPLRALVVSAPDEVHPQVGNLLGQMRAAP